MPYANFTQNDKDFSDIDDLFKKTGIKINNPTLPPKKLIKLTGTLSEFKAIFCDAPLLDVAYLTPEQRQKQLRQLRRGASAAMSTGNITGALVALGHADDNDHFYYLPAQYMTAKLNNEINLKGWTGFYHFKDGDEVEVVAEQHDDHYEVYAMLKPSEQIISIIPPCDGGQKQFLQTYIPSYFSFYFVVALIVCVIGTNGDWFDILHVFVLLAFVFGIMGYLQYRNERKSHVKLAEDIFRALGWHNVSRIDLRKMTKNHADVLIKQNQYPLKRDLERDFYTKPGRSIVGAASGLYYYQPEVVFGKQKKQK